MTEGIVPARRAAAIPKTTIARSNACQPERDMGDGGRDSKFGKRFRKFVPAVQNEGVRAKIAPFGTKIRLLGANILDKMLPERPIFVPNAGFFVPDTGIFGRTSPISVLLHHTRQADNVFLAGRHWALGSENVSIEKRSQDFRSRCLLSLLCGQRDSGSCDEHRAAAHRMGQKSFGVAGGARASLSHVVTAPD